MKESITVKYKKNSLIVYTVRRPHMQQIRKSQLHNVFLQDSAQPLSKKLTYVLYWEVCLFFPLRASIAFT